MYKYLLESAGDLDWMALLPLLIFVVFFSLVVVVTMLRDKNHIKQMAEMPITDDSENINRQS